MGSDFGVCSCECDDQFAEMSAAGKRTPLRKSGANKDLLVFAQLYKKLREVDSELSTNQRVTNVFGFLLQKSLSLETN